jgi:uncharacterized protein YbjT (DUF2867 family)
MRERVLVAGATGYLGRYLVRELSRRGFRVRALLRNEKAAARGGKAFAPPLSPHTEKLVEADVTDVDALSGVCDGVDWVISTVSLMAQLGKLHWDDVDYQGNLNLLREAERSGVKKFLYFSVYQAESLLSVPMVSAHERFVSELKATTLSATVVRPTGYYSDMTEIWQMARQGRVYLFGDGTNRINPIHGEDLAKASLDAFEAGLPEVSLGGPSTFTWNELATLAFDSIRQKPRITHIPYSLARALLEIARPFVPQRAALWDFFLSSAVLDFQAPAHGSHELEAFFNRLDTSGLAVL